MAAQIPVIAGYEKLEALTARLRDAASDGDWEQFADLQRQRSELLDAEIVPADATALLDEPTRARKNELIRRIQATEAEARTLVQSVLTDLEQKLREGRQELKLLKEYRRHTG